VYFCKSEIRWICYQPEGCLWNIKVAYWRV